jgi:hypothetical protein
MRYEGSHFEISALGMAQPLLPRLAASRECQIHEAGRATSSLSTVLKYKGIEFWVEIPSPSEIGVYLKHLTPSKHHPISTSPSEIWNVRLWLGTTTKGHIARIQFPTDIPETDWVLTRVQRCIFWLYFWSSHLFRSISHIIRKIKFLILVYINEFCRNVK